MKYDLEEINNFLKPGDKALIADKLGCDRKTVSRALNGHSTNERVLYAAKILADKHKQEIKDLVA